MLLLIGDSLTQSGSDRDGWVTSLTHRYSRKLDLLNRGLSGYTTRWYPASVLDSIPTHTRLVVVWLGTNDAVLPSKGIQHVPLEEYTTRLEAMLQKIHSQCPRVIVLTPPPLDESKWPDRSNWNTFKYREKAILVSRSLNLIVLDVWSIFGIFKDESNTDVKWEEGTGDQEYREPSQLLLDFYLNDGLHLSANGNQVVYKELIALIQKSYPDLDPDTMQPMFPWWRDRAEMNKDISL
jgi:lysophospholipase L1-like esterase